MRFSASHFIWFRTPFLYLVTLCLPEMLTASLIPDAKGIVVNRIFMMKSRSSRGHGPLRRLNPEY